MVGIVAGIEGGSSSSSYGTARQSLVRFQKRKHVITLCSFSVFQTQADSQTYTERCRLASEYMGSNTHTHQRTQLTISTNITKRDFLATAILSYYISVSTRLPHKALCESEINKIYDDRGNKRSVGKGKSRASNYLDGIYILLIVQSTCFPTLKLCCAFAATTAETTRYRPPCKHAICM